MLFGLADWIVAILRQAHQINFNWGIHCQNHDFFALARLPQGPHGVFSVNVLSWTEGLETHTFSESTISRIVFLVFSVVHYMFSKQKSSWNNKDYPTIMNDGLKSITSKYSFIKESKIYNNPIFLLLYNFPFVNE